MHRIGLILLAAGASTRLGSPKQLVHYQGQSLLRWVAEATIASASEQIVVVLGAHAAETRPELAGLSVLIVEKEDWEQRMASSLQSGQHALDTDLTGVVIRRYRRSRPSRWR